MVVQAVAQVPDRHAAHYMFLVSHAGRWQKSEAGGQRQKRNHLVAYFNKTTPESYIERVEHTVGSKQRELDNNAPDSQTQDCKVP